MDDVLEVVDIVADSGFEGIVTWLLRLAGIVAILAGLGLWLFTEIGLLIPALLILGGLVLVVAPSVLLLAAEFA